MRRFLIPILLIFVLASCRMPSIVPQIPAGTVDSGAPVARPESALKVRLVRDPQIQAIFEEFTAGATIALIDTETGLTLGTSVTTPEGSFILNFGPDFNPVDGRLYYLDLFKGLQVQPDGQFNQAGADALRLRNVLCYDAATSGWTSLMNGTPSNSVDIGNKSTALSIALALKRQAGELVDFKQYLGVVPYPNDYPAAGVGTLEKSKFDQAYAAVIEAIAKDSDPLQYLVYDKITGTYFGSLVLFSLSDIFLKGTDATPVREGKIDDRVIITGAGFGPGAQFRLNGKLLSIVGSIAATRVEVQIPPGTRTGPVSIEQEGKTQFGKTFTIKADDGHRAILNGKLYVASPTWHSISEVDQNGVVKTLWDKVRDGIPELDSPRQVAVRGGMIYVTTSSYVLRFNPAQPKVRDAFAIAVTDPYGMAFDLAGNLYVTSRSAGTIIKHNAAGTPLQTFAGFNRPIAMAFNYQGRLFVVEEGGGIRRVTFTPTYANEAWGFASKPLGIAVDSAGDQFVTSNDNDVIFRISHTGFPSVFAAINKPGGLSFDDEGNLFVSDTGRNLISRLSPSGNSKVIAYGISVPRGIAVDPASPRTLYVSLGQSNAILRVTPDTGALAPFVTGIANPMSLNFRGQGMFIAHPETGTISYARTSGEMETVATGILYPGGADQQVVGGVRTGNLYAGRFGDVEGATTPRLPNFAIRALAFGDHYGLETFNNGTRVEARQWLYHQQVQSVAVDSEGNIFMVNQAEKSLTMFTKFVETTGTKYARLSRHLAGPRAANAAARFTGTPGQVVLDPLGNAYVTVPSENAVYRFNKARGYAMEKITGFANPRGIAFSDTTAPVVMFVSNAGDAGRIYRVTNADQAAVVQKDGAFAVAIDPNVEGIAYMPSGTLGTGTLYISNNNPANDPDGDPETAEYQLDKVSIAGNNASGGRVNVFKYLPRPWKYIFAHPATGMLYGYINVSFVDKINPTTLAFDNHRDGTGSGVYEGYFMSFSGASYTEWNGYRYNGGLHNWSNGAYNLSPMTTTRELELDPGRYLYVASPENEIGEGGVLRINLTNNEELYLRLRAYSLGRDTSTDLLYIGAYDSGIYRMEPSGRTTLIWTVPGGRPFGLDVYTNAGAPANSRVWAAAEDSTLFEAAIQAGTTATHRVGMKGPVF